jgi:hypothetical protein
MFRASERQEGMDLAWFGRCLGAAVLSTLSMDLGATLCRKLGLTAGMPPELFARWLGNMLQGRVVHHTILEAPDTRVPMGLALATHYLIGITLTFTFWALLSQLPVKPLSTAGLAAAALGFGMLTNVLPWLIMFPAMGFGVLGKDGPADLLLFRSSLVNHAWFGIGLTWTLWVFGRVRA